jgi:hypothetical protein
MATPALLDDYLFLGPLLQARLVGQVPDVPVDVCETVQQVLAADRRPLVLMVMWAGDRFDETERGRAGNGASQVVFQRWLVLLALNNASPEKDARHLRAGPLLSAVHKALAGWTPEGSSRAMRRANAAMRPDITPQKAIYPMGFELQLTL